jgi:hypothetical protein
MTAEDVMRELARDPYVPLRLHLSSGQVIDIRYPHTAWVRQNTLLVVHPIEPFSPEIGTYEVIALRLIERIEQLDGGGTAAKRRGRKRA